MRLTNGFVENCEACAVDTRYCRRFQRHGKLQNAHRAIRNDVPNILNYARRRFARGNPKIDNSAGLRREHVLFDAGAVINLRIAPGESTASIIQYVRDVVADRTVSILQHPVALEPSAVS